MLRLSRSSLLRFFMVRLRKGIFCMRSGGFIPLWRRNRRDRMILFRLDLFYNRQAGMGFSFQPDRLLCRSMFRVLIYSVPLLCRFSVHLFANSRFMVGLLRFVFRLPVFGRLLLISGLVPGLLMRIVRSGGSFRRFRFLPGRNGLGFGFICPGRRMALRLCRCLLRSRFIIPAGACFRIGRQEIRDMERRLNGSLRLRLLGGRGFSRRLQAPFDAASGTFEDMPLFKKSRRDLIGNAT